MGYWTYLVNFMTHIYHSKGLKQWHVDEESSIEKNTEDQYQKYSDFFVAFKWNPFCYWTYLVNVMLSRDQHLP